MIQPTDAVAPARLKRAFRLGVSRRYGGPFKAVATVGLARDGGIFVAPADVRGLGWSYAVTHSSAPGCDPVSTDSRPKLHYHRSGIAAITLTGAQLRPMSLRLTPIVELAAAQVLSIVCVRPWELSTVEQRRGDIATAEHKWPHVVAFTISVVAATNEDQTKLILPGLAPYGFIPGDDSRMVVSLSAYGHRAALVIKLIVDFEEDLGRLPGTTVATIPRAPAGPTSADVLALWTSSLRNPIIRYEEDIPTGFQGVVAVAPRQREPGTVWAP